MLYAPKASHGSHLLAASSIIVGGSERGIRELIASEPGKVVPNHETRARGKRRAVFGSSLLAQTGIITALDKMYISDVCSSKRSVLCCGRHIGVGRRKLVRCCRAFLVLWAVQTKILDRVA